VPIVLPSIAGSYPVRPSTPPACRSVAILPPGTAGSYAHSGCPSTGRLCGSAYPAQRHRLGSARRAAALGRRRLGTATAGRAAAGLGAAAAGWAAVPSRSPCCPRGSPPHWQRPEPSLAAQPLSHSLTHSLSPGLPPHPGATPCQRAVGGLAVNAGPPRPRYRPNGGVRRAGREGSDGPRSGPAGAALAPPEGHSPVTVAAAGERSPAAHARTAGRAAHPDRRPQPIEWRAAPSRTHRRNFGRCAAQ
jgi:hypothetical protein